VVGISTCVICISDEQIQDFTKKPHEAADLFIGCINFEKEEGCLLHDYWDAIHYVLTLDPEGGELPLGAIKRGDVTYAGDLHAIYASTTKALARELSTLSEHDLRARFDPAKMSKAACGGRPVYSGRFWLFPELADDTFDSIMSYLGRLRDFTARAASSDKGLLFHRYEDF